MFFRGILTNVLDSIIAALVLFFLTKLMGKKQISQLSIFDYIVGISIGSIAAATAVDRTISVVDGVTSMVVWAVFPITFSLISRRSIKGRKFLDGTPTILIQNGKIVERNLNSVQFTVNDLLEELRIKDVFNIEDVEFAILETGGKLSVLKKAAAQTPTVSQLNLPVNYQGLTANVILDGKIIYDSLESIGFDENRLMSDLLKINVTSVSDVLLGCYDSSGKLYIDFKRKYPDIYNVLQ